VTVSSSDVHLHLLNGAANKVIEHLPQEEIEKNGSIVLEVVDACLSDTADMAEGPQSRFQSFTPVWELVDARIRADGVYPPSWFLSTSSPASSAPSASWSTPRFPSLPPWSSDPSTGP
jgi:hypothetical protein